MRERAMTELTDTVDKLCKASLADYVNPYERLQWLSELDIQQWFMTPEFISLYGTEIFAQLSELQQQQLSFFEAVNFFSLNIHGEKSLIEGLAHRLYRPENSDISPYLHHFLDEENKHMVYFGGFCMRYAGKIYSDRKLAISREYEPGEEDFLFFAKVMIFEEIVDVYNVRMSQDDRLIPIARQINLLHHRDEARHLVFGRKVVAELFERYSCKWSSETLSNVREYLDSYIAAMWKEYYNPDVYKDAHLQDPYELHELAMKHPKCRQHRSKVMHSCVKFLLENKILIEEPS
jgi:hypothetical protein